MLSQTIISQIPNIDLICRLSEFACESGVKLYLVGGAARDILLNKWNIPTKTGRTDDFDFAIDTDPTTFAQTFAQMVNARVIIMDGRELTMRLIMKHPRPRFDFTQFKGGNIIADLTRRDMTINAIAIDVGKLLSDAEIDLIDPCQGYHDLKSRTIRFTTDHSILNDPLCMLRAYRLVATLGFDIHPHSIAQIEMSADLLGQVAFERVRDEWCQILDVPNAATHIRAMDNTGLLAQIIPEIESMKGIEQNGYHHLDVWEHTLLALEIFEADLIPECLSQYRQQIKEYLRKRLVYGKRIRQMLKMAILLHDVGKPMTKSINERGWVRFIGHEYCGSEIANTVAMRLKLGGKAAEMITSIVRNHLHIMHLAKQGNPKRHALVRFLKNTGEHWLGVLLISFADLQASQGPLRTPEDEIITQRLMKRIATTYFRELWGKRHPRT